MVHIFLKSKQLVYIHIRMALRKLQGKNTFLMAPSLSAQENDLQLPQQSLGVFAFLEESEITK